MVTSRFVPGSVRLRNLFQGSATVVLVSAAVLLWAGGGFAATFSVTSTADSGAGTLRQAILDSNAATPGPNVISFAIAGSGPFTISPASALPTITVPVTINGYSQSGASANSNAFGAAINAVLEIIIDGTSAGASVDGLVVSNHTGTVIRGLDIRNFSGNGIYLTGTGGGHTVAGCFVGTNEAGSAAAANGANGILIDSANNTVGGSAVADRNLISGNGPSNVFAGVRITATTGTGNVVYGNYIGTSASGTSAIGNSTSFGYGVLVVQGASSNTIGSETLPGNVISGNGGALSVQGGLSTCSNNVIVGNRIGTNAAGTAALGNNYGIGGIAYAANTRIGGTTSGARNIISGNGSWGIVIGGSDSGTTTIQGNYIGTDIAGTGSVPNTGDGILYEDTGPSNTAIIGGTAAGAGNVIAFNTGNGVNFKNGFGTPTGNRVLGNSIHDNGALGIDLNNDGVTANDACDADAGPNDLQNFPVLTGVTTVSGYVRVVGTLNSVASSTYRIELFSNAACDGSGNGEGATYLGATTVTTDGSCNGAIDVVLPATVSVGASVTATATSSSNSTSEFSACATAAAGTLPSATALASSLNPSTGGLTVTFTATVTGGGSTPTGSVSFYDGIVLLGTVALDGAGQASFSTSLLSLGTHQITAQYGGSAMYSGSTSSVLTQLVNATLSSIPTLGGAGLLVLAGLLALLGGLAARKALVG